MSMVSVSSGLGALMSFTPVFVHVRVFILNILLYVCHYAGSSVTAVTIWNTNIIYTS